jgi:CheY-like chemotaxis protein
MFDKATTYIEAVERMASWTYDLVILDIMEVRGFDLLELAINCHFPIALISAHPLTPEVLKRSSEMNVPIYVLKEKLEEFLPFLEGILRYRHSPWWRHLFEKLNGFLIEPFESDWEKTTGLSWREWGKL